MLDCHPRTAQPTVVDHVPRALLSGMLSELAVLNTDSHAQRLRRSAVPVNAGRIHNEERRALCLVLLWAMFD